jgi:hypothetical protein
MQPNCYEVLGIQEQATQQEIRNAYRDLVRKVHPDHNPHPDAGAQTARLNDAYSVLSDARQRALHDAWLKTQRSGTTSGASSAPTAARPRSATAPPDVRCHRCQRRDPSLRLAVMHYVISLFVVTQRRGTSGVWCSRCRAIESWKWTALSCLMGWWGVPWGPIYTVAAIVQNAKGGDQPKSQNAALLRLVAFLLSSEGRLADARQAVEESLRLEFDPETRRFADYLAAQQPTVSVTKDRWRYAPAVPSAALCALLGWAIYLGATAPSGYEARYTGAGGSPVPSAREASPAKARVNALVERFAGIIAARAPVVGTHLEGSATITDHVLDRSKFSADELYAISGQIGSELDGATGDADGFIASSYFNARMFALSVDLLARMELGQPISEQVGNVEALAHTPAVQAWLSASRFSTAYQSLVDELTRYGQQYEAGRSSAELEADVKSSQNTMANLKATIADNKAPGDIDSYNALVDTHNRLLDRAKMIDAQLDFRSRAAQKLDLAFNRTLDPAILLGGFNQVNLTSNAAEVDRLAEPKIR